MEEIRIKYRITYMLVLFLMILSISIAYSYSIGTISAIYEKNATDNIIDIKKSVLKDNVNNIILDIERTKQLETSNYQRLINNTDALLSDYYSLSPDVFLDLSADYFDATLSSADLSVLIVDRKTDKTLFEHGLPSSRAKEDSPQKMDMLKEQLYIYKEATYGTYRCIYGITNARLTSTVQASIASLIHNTKFENESYIWVNEILDYDGGENYAIRRIHANLPDTEGSYLSTSTKDIAGNLPYLTELNGINENGEVFFTYFFNRLNSEEVSEKIAYAKLYKEYNWVIATGVYMDDVLSYVDKASSTSRKNIGNWRFLITFWFSVLFIVSMVVLTFLEKWYYKNSNKQLKDEINIDSLTKAFSRRAANMFLNQSFRDYKNGKESPAVMMIDIDDFKKINDTYGHDLGDHVLASVVEVISKHIRSSDQLCRWGGEEFLLLCQGLKEDDIPYFTNKILEQVSSYDYQLKPIPRMVSISIGISTYQPEDDDVLPVIKRADIAMYRAKTNGKNQACIYTEALDNVSISD